MELGNVKYKIQSNLLPSLTRIQRYIVQKKFKDPFQKADLSCNQNSEDTLVRYMHKFTFDTFFGIRY